MCTVLPGALNGASLLFSGFLLSLSLSIRLSLLVSPLVFVGSFPLLFLFLSLFLSLPPFLSTLLFYFLCDWLSFVSRTNLLRATQACPVKRDVRSLVAHARVRLHFAFNVLRPMRDTCTCMCTHLSVHDYAYVHTYVHTCHVPIPRRPRPCAATLHRFGAFRAGWPGSSGARLYARGRTCTVIFLPVSEKLAQPKIRRENGLVIELFLVPSVYRNPFPNR